MKTIRFFILVTCISGLMFLSCDKDGDTSSGGINGTWTTIEIKGNISFNNAELTSLVNSEFFGDVDDGDVWEFKSNGKMSIDDVNGTYTYTGDQLVITDSDDNDITFTATLENNTLSLKMKKADAENQAWYVAEVVANAYQRQYYDVILNSVSITFILKRDGGSSNGNGGGMFPF